MKLRSEVTTMELGSKKLHRDHIDMIVEFVHPNDLTNLSRASRFMRDVTRKPQLWRNMRVNKTKISQDGLTRLFSINKFSEVRVIDMSYMTLTPPQLVENLNAISSSSVEELSLRYVRIAQVPGVLLGEVAGKLIKLDLAFTYPTPDQCLALLKACASSTTLKDLSLEYVDSLSTVPPELLRKAVGRLQKVNLEMYNLKSDQGLAVLEACTSSTTLKDVSLRCARLQTVPYQLLAEGAGSLSKINLYACGLNKDQIIGVLGACISSSTLNDVDLGCNGSYMSQVPVDLLARAVANLARVGFRCGHLSAPQCLAVIETCISSPKLISVNLCGNDMRQVPPQKLGEAAGNLQKIVLDYCRLTTEQILVILQACATSPLLTDVTLVWNDLRKIPVDVLSQAVVHLLRFDLYEARMTLQQKTGVLKAIITSACTVHMEVHERYIQTIRAQVLGEARNTGRLKE